MTERHSFAVYLEQVQLTTPDAPDWTQRVQVLVLPSARGDEALHLVHRWQQRPGHRAVWRQSSVNTISYSTPLKAVESRTGLLPFTEIAQLTTWAWRPLITVRVPAAELAELRATASTPYKALERVKRAATREHGFTV